MFVETKENDSMKAIKTKYETIFNRKKKLNSEGMAVIQIRMYLNGVNRYYSTGIYITPNEWNEIKKKPKKQSLEIEINEIISLLADFERDCYRKNGLFTLSDFDSFGKKMEEPIITESEISFIDYMITKHKEEFVLNQPSWRSRRLAIDIFKSYKNQVYFSDLNFNLIDGFDKFLHKKKYHTNTIHKFHKIIKKYLNLAVKEDLLSSKEYPYKDIKIELRESKSQFLVDGEIERLEDLKFEKENALLEKARDMFLFSVYTGLRFNDVYKIKNKDFSESPEGLVLQYKANKTKKNGFKYLGLLFEGKPETIALKYIGQDENINIFKGLPNPKVNKLLKILAKMAKIPMAICFKDARDTFGTQLINKLPINIVQDELQHSNLRQTQKYLHLTNETKKQAFRELWKKK